MTRWKQTELTCRSVVEMVNDYLSDVMPADERASFEQHLHACPWCMTYLAQVRTTVALAGQLTEASAPPGLDAFELKMRALFRARRGE